MMLYTQFRQLQEGRKSAHATDVCTIKQTMFALLAMDNYNPTMKHQMGFKNPRCAALNCPADLDLATDLDNEGNLGYVILQYLNSYSLVSGFWRG